MKPGTEVLLHIASFLGSSSAQFCYCDLLVKTERPKAVELVGLTPKGNPVSLWLPKKVLQNSGGKVYKLAKWFPLDEWGREFIGLTKTESVLEG